MTRYYRFWKTSNSHMPSGTTRMWDNIHLLELTFAFSPSLYIALELSLRAVLSRMQALVPHCSASLG